MPVILFLFLLCLFLPGCRSGGGDCPATLNSPNCRVDCSGDAIDMLCVDSVEYVALQKDLDALGALDRLVGFYLWNLNNTGFQMESNLFGSVAKSITRISLQNVTGLVMFPGLRDLKNLTSLLIVGAPNMSDFSVESLPGW